MCLSDPGWYCGLGGPQVWRGNPPAECEAVQGAAVPA